MSDVREAFLAAGVVLFLAGTAGIRRHFLRRPR